MKWSEKCERRLFGSAALIFTILSIICSAGTWAQTVSTDGLCAASTGGSSQADDACRSTRSAPPDTTPYTRPVVPEDYAPQGKPAIPPGIRVPPPDQTLCKQTDDLRDSGGL